MTENQNQESSEQTGLSKFLSIAQVPHEGVAEAIKQQILEGNVNPLEALIALKRMEKVVKLTLDSSEGDKEVRDMLKEAVRTSLDGGKSIDIFGANLRLQATGTWYDFSECQDECLNELYKIQEQVKEAIKQRETEIKAILPPDDNKNLGIRSRVIVQEHMPHFEWVESGVDNTIFPPIKRAGESIICTFKKPK